MLWLVSSYVVDDTARRARRTWVSGHPSLKGRLLALTRRAIRSATDYAVYDDVVRTFAGLPVKIIKGAVPDTLPLLDCEKISYLSLDMNCTPPERAAIEFLWPRLVPGAVIVNDDYGHVGYDPQRQAFDEFAATQGLEVLVLPTGQGLLFKPAR